MRKLKWRVLIVVIASVMLLSACAGGNENEANNDDGKVQVVTTIAQIGEPLSVIGDEYVNVKSLMGPGTDPHLYKASHGDIRTLDQADIIFYNGLFLEGNMGDVLAQMGKTKPVMAVAETVDEESLIIEEDGAIDPHIWFNLDLWMDALGAAVEQLKEMIPDDAEELEQNKRAYFAELELLKEEAALLNEIPSERRVLVTAHDAFGYFGKMHNIEVVGLQGLSTDAEVGLTDIQATIDLIIERQVPAVFVESTINENTIRSVIEGAKSAGVEVQLGGELYSDAMGEAGKPEGTFIGMYRHNVETIYKALSGEE